MKRTALAIILAALAPLAFGQADETGAQPVRTPDRSTTCTLDALNETCVVALEGRNGAGIQLTTANYNGSIWPEISNDGGTTWTSGYFVDLFAWTLHDELFFVGGSATQQYSYVILGGITHVRAKAGVFTSGSISITVRATQGTNPFSLVGQIQGSGTGGTTWRMVGPADDGAAVSGAPVRIAGKNGSTTQDILTDANGELQVDVLSVAGTVTTDGIIKDGTGDTTQANVSSGRLHVDGSAPVTSANNDGACVSVAASTTVLASFASRKGFTVYARETNTDVVFIKMGGTATSSDFPLPAGSAYNMQAAVVYTGVIDAIAASGTQSVCVVEF